MSWKEYLVFTRRERIGILTITGFLIVLNLLPYFIPQREEELSIEFLQEEDREWLQNQEQSARPVKSFARAESKSESGYAVFDFDPNTLSEDDWKQLGISSRTAATIRNFISKGGSFRKPEDLSKIYGLSRKDYERLLPHVTIRQGNVEEDRTPETVLNIERPVYTRKSASHIDINKSDSATWERLPGIGVKLASRIILFRSRLGGFYSADQVKEVYGLPDSTFQKLRPFFQCDSAGFTRLKINSAPLEILQAHPYVKARLARIIVNYRKQHGGFRHPGDLSQIQAVSPSEWQKVLPYLDFSE